MKVSKEKIYLAAVASNFRMFMVHSFKYLHPSSEFLDNWHIDAIVYLLEQAIQGKERRIIINVPPRHMKSLMASVILPAYILSLDPTARIICISYSDDLAKGLAREFRRIVTSAWYQQLFPGVTKLKDTETEFVTEAGGYRYATSVEGTLTGKGADFIIIDDPIKPNDVYSDKIRNNVNEWYKSTVLSRLEDKMLSILIIVMQRLHVNDLSGYAEESGGFRKLSLSAIASRDEEIQVGESMFYSRKAGEALHSEREDLETLLALRNQLGPRIFDAQYQQQPEFPDGLIFRKKDIRYVASSPKANPRGLITVSIDTALSVSETSDYTAISVIYSDTSGHYIIHAERGRYEYEELKKKVLQLHEKLEKYPARLYFYVENAGTGIPLLQFLRNQGFSWHSYSPNVDKVRRAYGVLELFESGRVFFVKSKDKGPGVDTLVIELLTFPNGKHDDLVDTLTQVLLWAESFANPKGKIYLY